MVRFWQLFDESRIVRRVIVPLVAIAAVLSAAPIASALTAAVPEVSLEGDLPGHEGHDGPFIDTRDGEPVVFDACDGPIPVLTWTEHGPENAEGLIDSALAEIGELTGIEFDDRGSTSSSGRQEGTLVIGFAPVDDPAFRGEAPAGIAWTQIRGAEIASATAFVNVDSNLRPGSGPGPTEGNVLLHEVAHAIGLAHNEEDQTSVMFPIANERVVGFSAIDKGHLAEIGEVSTCDDAEGEQSSGGQSTPPATVAGGEGAGDVADGTE